MIRSPIGTTTNGIHVQSTDSAERARLIASVRACGIPNHRSADGADLVLMGSLGASAADCDEHSAKRPQVPFALTGDRIGPGMLEAAGRAGVVAILPEATPSHRFAVALRRALAVAQELLQLRRWAVEVDDPKHRPADAESGPSPERAVRGEERTVVSDPSRLADRLVEAVTNDAFELVYQPKVNAGTRSVLGFEALIRWTDPVCGEVSPAVFIPVAEELGLIERIGEFCINEACSQAARWTALGLDPGRVAVNASPVQFQRANFAGWLIDAVADAGLDRSQFELEITEGCLLDSEEAIATVTELSDAGVHIAVDDFGTGYSSLQYLRHLPIHCLKIDRVFVTDLESDVSARSLTAAIISLAWNLGLRVVAEGVETDFQWRFLADHGCDEIQGFRFSRPLSATDAERLLYEERARTDQD